MKKYFKYFALLTIIVLGLTIHNQKKEDMLVGKCFEAFTKNNQTYIFKVKNENKNILEVELKGEGIEILNKIHKKDILNLKESSCL